MTLKEEKEVKKYLKKVIKEAIFNELENNNQFFAPSEEKKSNDEKKADNSDRFGNKNIATKSRAVIQKLKDPSTNDAAIMKQLWHPDKEEEDAKRSLFSKKVRHAKNDNGTEYGFTPHETNTLYQILSNGSI